jgi:PAS domain S-box-containing protein
MTINGIDEPVSAISDAIGSLMTYRKRIVRTLRFLLLMAVIGMAYPIALEGHIPWQFWLAAGLFFATNVAYHFDKTDIFQKPRLSALLFLFDSSLLTYMLIIIGENSNEFFILFAMTVLMAAMSRNVTFAFASTVAVGALYSLLTLYGKTGVEFLSADFLTRLALLFVVSIFIGYLSYETHQARCAPRLGADLYRGLFELSPAYLFLCNRRLQIIQTNPAVESGLGYRADDLRGHSLSKVAEFPETWCRAESSAAWPKHVGGLTLMLFRRDGSRLPVNATLVEVPSSAGPLLMVVAQPEQRGKAPADPVFLTRIESRAALGELAPGVANEAHGAMMLVAGCFERLAARITDPETCGHLKDGKEAVDRALQVLREFQLFSRAQAAEKKPFFSLNAVIASVLRLKAHDLQARQIAVEWQPDAGLPEVVGDPRAIGQVVLNLLQNAQDAVESRASDRRVRLRTGHRNDQVWFEVVDDGPGIPPEAHPRLFEPFVTCKPEGTGLGLFASRVIVWDHGGSITLQSEREKGPTFRVELPAAVQQDTNRSMFQFTRRRQPRDLSRQLT